MRTCVALAAVVMAGIAELEKSMSSELGVRSLASSVILSPDVVADAGA